MLEKFPGINYYLTPDEFKLVDKIVAEKLTQQEFSIILFAITKCTMSSINNGIKDGVDATGNVLTQEIVDYIGG